MFIGSLRIKFTLVIGVHMLFRYYKLDFKVHTYMKNRELKICDNKIIKHAAL